jgi:hypothetical protein
LNPAAPTPRLLADRVCGGSSPASRSFVLTALRALHLDPGCGPPTRHQARKRGQTNQTTTNPTPFTGIPNTDKDHEIAGRIGPPTVTDLDYLAGFDFLACYCEAAEPCHADVIFELLANRLAHLTSVSSGEKSSATTEIGNLPKGVPR